MPSLHTESRLGTVIHFRPMTTDPPCNSQTADEQGTPGSTRRRATLLLAAMLIVVLVVPTLLGRARVAEPFDQSAVDRLDSAAPEIVFLGNSLLETRIDTGYLDELAGVRSASLAVDGTGPGAWYLQLKNVIGASANRPQRVFIFFHDDLITRPISFTGRKDNTLTERLSRGIEADYRLVVSNTETFDDRIRRVFTTIYPLTDASSPDRNSVGSAGAFLAGTSRAEASAAADRFFDFANRRAFANNPDIQQPKFHGVFDFVAENSFLPLLIGQANELSVELIFVRVSARPMDGGTPNEPDVLARYTSDLSDYLATNGVHYIDMTGHPDIDAGMYYDGYHLINRYRSLYTEIFSELLLPDRGDNP